jgi:O-antigen/teichoic acid export membrane protein
MLKKIFKSRIVKTDFVKNVGALLTGTAIAQAITLLFSVILSRLYSPEEFGNYALFASLVAGVSVIVCGRFELAIVLPKEDKEAHGIMHLSFIFSILVSSLFFLVVLILVLLSKINAIYLLAPVSTFLLGNFQTLNNWYIRKQQYKIVSKSRIYAALSNMLVSFLLGIFGFTKLGLIFSHSASSLFTNFTLKGYLTALQESLKVKYIDLKLTFIKYSQFIKYNAWQALSEMLVINGVFYLLPFFYEKYALGFFSFAIRILQAPMSLLGSSIAQVFFQQAADNKNKNISNNYLVLSTIKKSAIVILPMPIVMYFWGPSIFAGLFGDKWRMAGELAGVMSFWFYFDFIRATVSQFPIVLNKQKTILLYSLIGNIILFSVIAYFGLHSYSMLICFKYLSFFMSIYTVFIIFWIYNLSKQIESTP